MKYIGGIPKTSLFNDDEYFNSLLGYILLHGPSEEEFEQIQIREFERIEKRFSVNKH